MITYKDKDGATVIILQSEEDIEAFSNTLPKVKYGFRQECPLCKQSIKLPYECAGKEVTCTCGFTYQIRRLTSKERVTFSFIKHRWELGSVICLLLMCLILFYIF